MTTPYIGPGVTANPYTGNGGSADAQQLAILPVGTDATTFDRPDFKRPEYTRAQGLRQLCNDLMAGSHAIKARGKVYLPKWPAEKEDKYLIRAAIANVAGYYQRTVQASVGMICSTPPTLAKDTAQVLLDDWEDIDGKGTHGEVASKMYATEAINGGFVAVLVDAPPIPDGLTLTLADEQALGLRPFWVTVTADRLISWVVDVPDWLALLRDYAAGVLTAEQVKSYAKQSIVRQVVIHEPTDVRRGAYGVTCADRYRVLRLTDTGVTFDVWEHRTASESGTSGEHFVHITGGVMLQAGRKPFREIPLAVIYGGRKMAPFDADPPLLALGELNLDHYQVSADRRYLMRLCHAPTLTLSGYQPEIDETGRPKKVEVGPNSVLTFVDPQGKAAYVAAESKALDSSKEEKDEIVRQMATLGMSFLGKDRRGQAETATGRALDDAAENASHATVGRGLQDGLEEAFRFHAMYRGVPAPEVTVNTTYAAPEVDPQLASVLWQAVAAGELDIGSWIQYIQTGSLPDDVALRLDVLKLAAVSAADATATATQASQESNGVPSGAKGDAKSGIITDKRPAGGARPPTDTAPNDTPMAA